MGTKHIRHLVTELAARLSDRDFLRKAGISRRTMQEIFVRDKWEEALESLFPIRERLSCKQILELCPFSVVVLGKFRRFLLVIFLSLFLHLDFSFIYSKFSMPFWGFFY